MKHILRLLGVTVLLSLTSLSSAQNSCGQYKMVIRANDGSSTDFSVSTVDTIYWVYNIHAHSDVYDLNGHEYVDLGLPSGTLWATMNVGAEKPEDNGDYFAWGETTGYFGGKTSFTWETYKWGVGEKNTVSKYCTDERYGTVDNKTELDLEDDAARVNWGGDWRMPSKEQLEELCNECWSEWTNLNGTNGHRFISLRNKKYIFIPEAGRFSRSYLWSPGLIWSRSLTATGTAAVVRLTEESVQYCSGWNREYGLSVRPILDCKGTASEDNRLKLSKPSATLSVSQGDSIYVSSYPSGIADSTIRWTSSDLSVVAVENGGLRFVSEGKATITAASAENPDWTDSCQVLCVGELDGHGFVDLGLPSGTLWATCNVGALKPEDYGDYFAWGETTGFFGGKTSFSWESYKWGNESYGFTKYCTNSVYGKVDYKTSLENEDDAAYINWGNKWQMPTYKQLKEIDQYCSKEYIICDGVYGYVCTSKTNGNSIFLPMAGSQISTKHNKDYCRYLSKELSDSMGAVCLDISQHCFHVYGCGREYGYSVRPVITK